MGRRAANSDIWAICKGCRHSANIKNLPDGKLVCSRCGSHDYTLTGNDPSKPKWPKRR